MDTFYYVPAPGKPVAFYRDWLVMLLCRPFFKNIILHWHAAGLAKWLETSVQIRTRAVTYRLFKPAGLEHRHVPITMSPTRKNSGRGAFAVVNNGIPDPCPDFANGGIAPAQGALCRAGKTAAGETFGPAELQPPGAIRTS